MSNSPTTEQAKNEGDKLGAEEPRENSSTTSAELGERSTDEGNGSSHTQAKTPVQSDNSHTTTKSTSDRNSHESRKLSTSEEVVYSGYQGKDSRSQNQMVITSANVSHSESKFILLSIHTSVSEGNNTNM